MTLPYELRWAFDPAGDCACESIVDLGNGLFCDPHIAPTLPLANSEETWHRHFDGGNGQPADRTMPCRHHAELFLDIAETFSRPKEFDVVLHFGTLDLLPNPLLSLSHTTCSFALHREPSHWRHNGHPWSGHPRRAAHNAQSARR
jgi:hypothetical protein